MALRTLFTIGHSTHSIEEFIDLVKAHGIEQVADVRSIPKSRHVPQFNTDALRESLRLEGIHYTHVAKLGGRRHTRKDSINTGWRNASFRGYADCMATPPFAEGLAELIEIARARRTAMMCAEAVPWRCHRSLVADAMTVEGWKVRDLVSAATPKEHELTAFLKVEEARLTYPAGDDAPGLFS